MSIGKTLSVTVTPPPPITSFSCHQAANGGWVIQNDNSPHLMPVTLGAFTTSADLLTYLHGKIVAQTADEATDEASE